MTAYYELGTHRFTVTTASPEAQLWFDRGLAWCYGFNHAESVRCFRLALDADPGCAMAHWGVAYALGPNYNKAWAAFDPVELASVLTEAHAATAEANMRLVDGAAPVEQALIGALPHRYPTDTPGPDPAAWVEDYAGRMRDVHARFPEHPDICALFAEALMQRTPWRLWDLKTGAVADGASTAEAIDVLESAMARIEAAGDAPHPGLLHMYIHLMEMSPHPERALRPADQLRGLVPAAGHLHHIRQGWNRTCLDIPAVAREMMLGEIAYRRPDHEAAFAHLRRAVELDDALPYDEPWGWMQPTRHALAALLLDQGHVDEAAAIYRADLGFDDTLSRACQHPDNVWSLHGYHECLTRLDRAAEAEVIAQRLRVAMARTDVPVTASCYCRLDT